jgi:DNA polymerase-3 subunit delta'
MEQAFEAGRLHHAYLFAGIDGIGKETVASSLGAIINCSNRQGDAFSQRCGECGNCRKFESDAHPDLMRVEPTGKTLKNIKIDQIREVENEASKQPYEARCRIVIVDGAHFMTEEAANALLKTLEEPDTEMRFFLISERPNSLLDTIRSRCQMLRFGALEEGEVLEILREELDDEQLDELNEERLRLAARYAEGSPGRAIEVLESEILDRREQLFEGLTELDISSPVDIIEYGETLTGGDEGLAENIDVLRLFLRDVLVHKKTDSDEYIVNEDMYSAIREFAGRFSTDDILEQLDALEDDERMLERRVKPKLIAEEIGFRTASQ